MHGFCSTVFSLYDGHVWSSLLVAMVTRCQWMWHLHPHLQLSSWAELRNHGDKSFFFRRVARIRCMWCRRSCRLLLCFAQRLPGKVNERTEAAQSKKLNQKLCVRDYGKRNNEGKDGKRKTKGRKCERRTDSITEKYLLKQQELGWEERSKKESQERREKGRKEDQSCWEAIKCTKQEKKGNNWR